MQTRRRMIGNLCFFGVAANALVTLCSQPALANPVAHDAIDPLRSDVDNLTEEASPLFSYGRGCRPYPAVDIYGNTSGGLKPTGQPDGDCGDESKKMTYTRFTHINYPQARRNTAVPGADNAMYAIMYSQFFPKDQGENVSAVDGIAVHRFDWEEVVVFFNAKQQPIKAAFSSHKTPYTAVAYNDRSKSRWSGKRIKVQYKMLGYETFEEAFATTNAFHRSNRSGESAAPLFDWDLMNAGYREQVQDALANTDWGSASPKFVDAKFADRLKEAWDTAPTY